MKQLWKAGMVLLALVALAGAALGIVSAQSEGEGEATPQVEEKGVRKDEFLSRLAENLGISQEQLEAAMRETALEIVDEKVADGTLTEEQAAGIRERIEQGEFPFFGKPHHRPHLGGYLGGELAEFLGITAEQFRDARLDGQSIAQIAEANGKSRDEVIDFLVGQMEKDLAAKVEEGKLDQARADEILERFKERVGELVDQTEPLHPHRPGFGGPFAPEERPGEDPTSA